MNYFNKFFNTNTSLIYQEKSYDTSRVELPSFTLLNSNEKENKLKITQNIIPKSMKFLKNKSLKFVINAQCNAVKNIFKAKKIPFRQITFSRESESELGKIYTFFVLETILLARLMNINPFDQPAVEQVKIETKKILR